MVGGRLGAMIAGVALMAFAHASSAKGVTGVADATAAANAALVSQAFDDWKHGRGGVFDLLADDAIWTVAGTSPVSGVYRSRQALIRCAVEPIHAQLSTPITPEVRHVLAQGDQVVAVWHGTATARDGNLYENDYAWHMVLKDGRITRVTAFLDTWRLDALMAGAEAVSPGSGAARPACP